MRIAQIVVPVDFSDRSQPSVRYAAAWARDRQAALTLVHATDRDSSPVRERLEQLAALAAGLPVATAVVVEGDPADRIARFAADKRADLIVIATRQRKHTSDYYLGSVANRVLESSKTPVICMRADMRAEVPKDHIIVAVDLSEYSARPLAYAIELSRDLGAVLTVVHVAGADRDAINARLAGLLAAAHAETLRTEVLQADAAGRLLEFAAHELAQLLVIGIRPHLRLSDLLLGSVAMRVIPMAPCPVACVRTDLHRAK